MAKGGKTGKETRAGAVGPEARTLPGAARRWEGRVQIEGEAERADRYVADSLALMTRSQLKARDARFFVAGRAVKSSHILKGGEDLAVEWTEEASEELLPEDLPLVVVHEDERTIVVDKAQGMVTHPGHGNRRGTFVNALLGHLAKTAAAARDGGSPGRQGAQRGGIVHRLDKDTSGLLIAAKDAEAQAFLQAQFKDRLARKEYIAVTRGIPSPSSGRIENRLGRDRADRKRFAAVAEGETGRSAVTDYRVLATYGDYALLSLRPRTGRTHQLRVHMAGLGTPVVGDPIYGKQDKALPGATLMLHAFRLRISLPGESEPRTFKAGLPERFRRLLGFLEKRYGRTLLK